MDMKKIWIVAFILGVIAAGAVYLTVVQQPEKTPLTTQQDIALEEEDTEDEKDDTSILEIVKGKRAVAVPVSEVQGVGGFLEPNDRVDVVTVSAPQEAGNAAAQILIQNIRVLAAGSVTTESEEKDKKKKSYETVTLEVTPEEGTSLAAAANRGAIFLMLRKKGDTGITSQTTSILGQLEKGGTP